jgi:hypothetical protein
MSPEAVTRRLKQTSELRKLCVALGGDRLRKRLKRELEEALRRKDAEKR